MTALAVPDDEENDRRYRSHIAPLAAALVDLVEHNTALRHDHNGLPEADSKAMAELAAESKYAGRWSAMPVQDAWSISWMILSGAEDTSLALCQLVEAPRTAIYAHSILARAVIDQCARAAWLIDPSVSVETRIARGMSERLFSLAEQEKLPDGPDTLDERRRVLDGAKALGLSVVSGKKQSVVSIGERRKTSTALVAWLYEHDNEFGELLFRFWSAVTHGTLYGVRQNFERIDSRGIGPTGLRTGQLAVTSEQVRNVLSAVLMAHVQVGKFHRELFGWSSPEWEKAVLNSLRMSRAEVRRW